MFSNCFISVLFLTVRFFFFRFSKIGLIKILNCVQLLIFKTIGLYDKDDIGKDPWTDDRTPGGVNTVGYNALGHMI